MTFLKFESFAYAFQGTIFDNYITEQFEMFHSDLTCCLAGKW